MNCPHCETSISEHEANRCLDAWVAKARMGYARIALNLNDEQFPIVPHPITVPQTVSYWWGRDIFELVPHYSTDIAAAWEVHGARIGELFSKRRRYILALEEELREREKHIVAWPDALIFLSPLTICRAALKATVKEFA